MLGEYYRAFPLDQADRLHLLEDGDVVLILSRPLLVARNEPINKFRAREYRSAQHPHRTLTTPVRLLLQKYIEMKFLGMTEPSDAFPPHHGTIAVRENAGIHVSMREAAQRASDPENGMRPLRRKNIHHPQNMFPLQQRNKEPLEDRVQANCRESSDLIHRLVSLRKVTGHQITECFAKRQMADSRYRKEVVRVVLNHLETG